MKTKLFTVLAAVTICFTQAKATDLCVNENGNGGCYSTITAAINAAANGDRVLIQPKAGNAPYVENLTINKTLQFLCSADTQKYFVQGNINITPANGRSITFIGMKVLGNIAPTVANGAGARCNVTILGSEVNGNVNFNYDNFNFVFASNILNGYVAYQYGKVIGNEINCTSAFSNPIGYSSAVYVGNDGTSTNDTIYVVGNHINFGNMGWYSDAITCNSQNQYLYVANNYMDMATSYYSRGIFFYNYKNSAVSRNIVMNNTIYSAGQLYCGILFYTAAPANSYTDVYNNLLMFPTSSVSYGSIYGATGTIGASYNTMSIPMVNSYDNGTNLVDLNLPSYFNSTSGQLLPGSGAINAGSPDFSYYDLDLTINDAGAWGGSLSQSNFFPITGSARVFMVYAPRRVNVSGTINIKADSFDR